MKRSLKMLSARPASLWRRLRPRIARDGGPSFESRLVWMLGSPRSGSTWLLGLLDGHRAVVPVNEPLIGDHLAPFISERAGIRASDLGSESFILPRLRADVSSYVFATEFKDVWAPLLGGLIRGRLHAHVRRYGAVPPSEAVAVVKEPNGSQGAELIMAALPRSRLLFLLRDGRDVVDSELAAAAEGGWLTELFPMAGGVLEEDRLHLAVELAHKWLWRTEAVQAAMRSHPGSRCLVRYEELRADPVAELRRIFDWLELEIGEEELTDVVERYSFERIPAESRGPSRFFRAAEPGLWRENLSEDEQAAITEVIGPKLSELGYGA